MKATGEIVVIHPDMASLEQYLQKKGEIKG
jgi:hypothetical protein